MRRPRQRVADTEEAAARLAVQVNAQPSSGAQTPFSFEPATVPELPWRFLDYHEHRTQFVSGDRAASSPPRHSTW